MSRLSADKRVKERYPRLRQRLSHGIFAGHACLSGVVSAGPQFLDDRELRRAWNSEERVFIFVPQHERLKVEALLPGPLHIASEASGKLIFVNHP